MPRYLRFKKEVFNTSKYVGSCPRKYAFLMTCIKLSSLAYVVYQSILWTFENKGISIETKERSSRMFICTYVVLKKGRMTSKEHAKITPFFPHT